MLIGNQNYIASSTALLACIVVMNLLEIEDQQIKLQEWYKRKPLALHTIG